MSIRGVPVRLPFVLIPLLLLATTAPARAQYLYLDANGDGLSTPDDVLNPTGPTTIDVWLQTDATRDGAPAPCEESASPKDASTFELALEALGGTVLWSEFSLALSGGSCRFSLQDETTWYSGFCDIVDIPAGLHRIGSLTVTPLTGEPSIFPLAERGGAQFIATSFGSRCPGPYEDNTHRLAYTWFDADGVRYGGWPSPPALEQPAAMEVDEGDVAEQTLSATDPDGGVLTFSVFRGPKYLTVLDTGPGHGIARLAPGYRDAGRAEGIIAVGDGVGMDFRAFAIRVLNVNGPPEIDSIPDICIGRPGRLDIQVGVGDPDGDATAITVDGLPPGAAFLPGAGHARISYTSAPWSKEATYHVTLSAADGSRSASRSFDLRIDDRCTGLAASVRVEPNPMRSRGTMTFRMMSGGPYRVLIYDVQGRLVQRLESGSVPTARDVTVPLDLGRAGERGSAATGVYFYEVQTRQGVARGRFVAVR